MLTLKIRRLGYTLFIASMLGCGGFTNPPPPDCKAVIEKARKASSEIKKPLCIVLCDFSSSMDPGSIDRVQKEALKIFDGKYDQADLKFYQVTTSSEGSFFNSDMILLVDSLLGGERNRIIVQSCLDSNKQGLNDSLKNALQTVSTSKSPDTYIIQSLETAIDFINQRDSGKVNKHTIYILSDMLESGTSSFGSIDLERQRFEDNINKVNNRADDPEAYSTMADNVTIKVVLLSRKVTDRSQLMGFWNVVFKKLGYKHTVVPSSEVHP